MNLGCIGSFQQLCTTMLYLSIMDNCTLKWWWTFFFLGRQLPEHPHVVKCYGYTTDHKGEDHIIFEWIEAEDLRHILPQMPRIERMAILTAVAKAMAHLHNHDIVHNDIALRNILVCYTQPLKPENIKICGNAQYIAHLSL